MKCTPIRMPGGEIAIVCSQRTGGARCSAPGCGGRRATLLCDFPGKISGTCSKPLCAYCAVRIAENVDYCPDHPRIVQGELPV